LSGILSSPKGSQESFFLQVGNIESYTQEEIIMNPIGNEAANTSLSQAIESLDKKSSRASKRVSVCSVESIWGAGSEESDFDVQTVTSLSKKKVTFLEKAGEVIGTVKRTFHSRRNSVEGGTEDPRHHQDILQRLSCLLHNLAHPSEQNDTHTINIQGIQGINEQLMVVNEARAHFARDAEGAPHVITKQLAENIRTHLSILLASPSQEPAFIEGFKVLVKEIVRVSATYTVSEEEKIDQQRYQLIKKVFDILKALPYETQLSLIDAEFIQYFKRNGCPLIDKDVPPTMVLEKIYGIKAWIFLSSIEKHSFDSFSPYLGMNLLPRVLQGGEGMPKYDFFIGKLIQVHFTKTSANAFNVSAVQLGAIATSLRTLMVAEGDIEAEECKSAIDSRFEFEEEKIASFTAKKDCMRLFSASGTQLENDMYMYTTSAGLSCQKMQSYFSKLAPLSEAVIDKIDAFYLYFLDEAINAAPSSHRLSTAGLIDIPLEKLNDFLSLCEEPIS